MAELLDIVGSVTIRINVDRENIDEAKDVVLMFKDADIDDPRIDFRLGFINDKGLVECVPHDCFSESEFREAELEFKYFLADCEFMVFGRPAPMYHTCGAAKKFSYVIDPLGRIGKCVPEVGKPHMSYCKIEPDDILGAELMADCGEVPYGEFDPFVSQKCCGCEVLRVCLGQCPRLHERRSMMIFRVR